jgi:signal transduction histidine kinase
MERQLDLNRRRPRAVTAAASLAAAILTACIVLAVQARATQNDDLKRDARTQADDVAARLTGAVNGAVTRINVAAKTGIPPDPLLISGVLTGVTTVTPGPNNSFSVNDTIGVAPRAPSKYIALLDVTRDTGDPQVDGDIVAVAMYSGQPKSTVERRQLIKAYLVGQLDGTKAVNGQGTVRIVTHTRTWRVGPARDSAPQATATATAAADRWLVDVWLPSRGLPSESVLAVIFGVVLALAVVALTIRGTRLRAVEMVARRNDVQALRVVTEAAAVLQGGFDIGVILPSVVVSLIDELGLEGAGVLEADDHGHLGELFSMGPRTPVPRTTGEIGPIPEQFAPGETIVVPLQRGGRLTGALWLRPQRDVPAPLVTAVRGVAELLQSAIANFRVYETQQENVRRLEELDQLKTAFIGTVSHELRTPATAIVGFGSMLEANWEKLTDEQRRDFARRATRNAKSLGVLIEDLLDFARLERGTAGIRVQPIDLSQLLLSLLDRLSGVFETHEVLPDVEDSVVAPADATAVERILTNLLSNATKYSPAGSPVGVALHRVGRQAVLTVDDSGSGIPAEERSRIFSPFYRMETEAVRRTRGAGIGLAVVRELTEALGATIAVSDSPLGGARFTVIFPLEGSAPASGPDAQTAQGVEHAHAT